MQARNVNRDVVRSVASAVPRRQRAGAKKYFHFNGVDQYAEMASGWINSGTSYQVKLSIIPRNAISSAAKWSVSSNSTSTPRITKLGTTNLWAGVALDNGAVQRSATSATAAVLNTQHDIVFDVTPGNWRTLVNGVAGAGAAFTCAVPGLPWWRVGGQNSGTNYHIDAQIFNVQFIDITTPANSRYFPMNEGSGTKFFCYSDALLTTPYPAGDMTIVNPNAAGGGWEKL